MVAATRGIGMALTALRGRKTKCDLLYPTLILRRYCDSARWLSSAESPAVDRVGPPPPEFLAARTVKIVPHCLHQRVLIYDGVCQLSHTGVKWIIKTDRYKKIKFCCVQSQAAEPYLRSCGLSREDVISRILFYEGLCNYHQGSDAVLRVLSYMPAPYSLFSHLMGVPPHVREAVYDYVAEKRPVWGFGRAYDCLVLKETRLLHCFIDQEELLERKLRKSE
ncbi:hypothetical protein CDL12_14227 [Handroanthus impetiginosus]|uniref:Uncharacterized protein n=1 Tax=Handroanthus impetiginosus TaxID=429701 RepID=A0A2G9H6L5_9LAMI|nr:hypothetical protein CDL12_14227 [Handroanthus impetiginosus]